MIKRAHYKGSISTFLTANPDQIFGELAKNHHFELGTMQKNAWIEEIRNLKMALHDFQDGDIFLEFSIPRMGRRVDVLLVISGVIFVIEYKAGANSFDGHAIDQVMDYALDRYMDLWM